MSEDRSIATIAERLEGELTAARIGAIEPDPRAGPPPHGVQAGRAISEVCDTAANDIENAALALVASANDILKEAQEIASGIRARGDRIKQRIESYTESLKRVGLAMRDTRDRIESQE